MSTASLSNCNCGELKTSLCDFQPKPARRVTGDMSHLAYGENVVAAALAGWLGCLADYGCFAVVIFLISRLMQSAASDCVRPNGVAVCPTSTL